MIFIQSIRSFLGLTLIYMGDFKKAIDICRKNLKIHRKFARSYYQLGLIHYKKGKINIKKSKRKRFTIESFEYEEGDILMNNVSQFKDITCDIIDGIYLWKICR